jgi:hypothetical protein
MRRLSAVVSDEEYTRIERLARAWGARSVAQLVRQAVREYAEKAGSIKLLSLRDMPPKQARKEVEDYLRSHPGVVWPDEMAEELGIDYRTVLRVVQELLREGKAEEARVEVVRT